MRHLPAEWAPQERVLFSFPRRGGDWGDGLDEASRAMIAAANAVHAGCPVTLVVGDPEHFAAYAADFRGEVIELPTDDCWIRDSGPITVATSAGPLLLDYTFNGWGGKFNAERDNRLPERLHQGLYPTLGYQKVDAVLEGGSIEVDGRGTLLTTTRCLLSAGRNGYRSRGEAERMLAETLGAERFIWLEHGELIGDDTDAHVDTVARFLTPDTIAYVGPPSPDDPHHADFVALREELREQARDYRLLELPWAGTLHSSIDGHRLPASYANFLISNGTLYLPVYGVAADREAQKLLESESPYRVVPVDCRPFIEQHGALHCLTMQIPALDGLRVHPKTGSNA